MMQKVRWLIEDMQAIVKCPQMGYMEVPKWVCLGSMALFGAALGSILILVLLTV